MAPAEPNGNEGKPALPFATHKTLDDGGGLISFVGSSRAGDAGTFPTWTDDGGQPLDAGTFQFTAP